MSQKWKTCRVFQRLREYNHGSNGYNNKLMGMRILTFNYCWRVDVFGILMGPGIIAAFSVHIAMDGIKFIAHVL
jgi:hypothetical protein